MMERHSYRPSATHMGDCDVCGNIADHPLHRSDTDTAALVERLRQEREYLLAVNALQAAALASAGLGDQWHASKKAKEAAEVLRLALQNHENRQLTSDEFMEAVRAYKEATNDP